MAMATASEDLGSPRDAIRNWLSRTNSCDKPSVGGKRYGHDMDEDMHRKYQQPADHHSVSRKVPQEKSVFSLRQPRMTEAKALQTDAECIGRARLVDKPAQTLPSRLGLQTPFRLLGEEALPQDLQRHDTHHTKKRRSSISSDTTYLQPATAAVNVDSENGKRSRSRRHHLRVDLYKVDDDDLTPSTISSSSCSVTNCSPMKPTRTYDRRPRNKTRDNRYDKKQVNELAKAKANKATKKGGKRKRKTRSGAPTHEFRAKNVAQDRLTLRPVQRSGLFKKGRASTPVRRRGLPDLSFSEMTFLSTRRDRDRETEEITHRNKRHRKDKAADAEDEISRFFTSARVPTADSDGEIRRTGLHGQGAVRDTRRRRSKNKRRASSVNSSALPESIAAADLPGRPFLGFGNRGSRPLSSCHVHRNTSDTSTAKSPIRVLSESTVGARSHFTWSISGAASHGSGTDGVLNCMASDPLGKVDGGASREPVLDAGQLNLSGPTICRCHCQPDGRYMVQSPKGDKLRVDAAMPNAASVESPKPAEQDQTHQRNIQEVKPEDQKNERQSVANASGTQQAARLGAADVSDGVRVVPQTPALVVEESITMQEEIEVYDLGIDRLLHECRTEAADVAHRQEERHNQAATQEEQKVPSPFQSRQFDSHTVKIVDVQEPMENCDRYPQQIGFNNAAAPDRENGAGMTHDCTIRSEPGSNAHQSECNDLYRRNVLTNAIESYYTVPPGHENVDRNASQEARRFHGSYTPDQGGPVTERSDALMRESNVGITSGSWPLAYDYNLVGPSVERMSHQSLYAAQDSKWLYFPQPFDDGRHQGQPINYQTNDVEEDVEGWNPPSDGVTVVQDLGTLGEHGFSDSYGQTDGLDALPITSSAMNASMLEQGDSRGHPRHRLVGFGSSAALSPVPFSRLGSSGSIFSRGTADQRYANSPPMPGFWQPHKLY